MSALSLLENVNNAITECMDKDEQPWDYYDQLQSTQNGTYHYDSNRLIKFNEISIPTAISDSLNHQTTINNQGYFGGFFESINRAYFVINSSIYLWDYSNKNRWCCLNQFNDTITSICLVKSKKNIFIDKIQYLLIVATKVEIIIVGIGFTNNLISGEIEAFPTKYKISTDNAQINKIICDPQTKRIFLSCDHGNVYEFEYFYKQNLFGQHIRKCIKTNISDSFTSKIFKSVTVSLINNDNIIDLIIHNDIFYTKCLFSLSATGNINAYKFYENKHIDEKQTDTEQHNHKYPITKILTYNSNKLINDINLQIQQMTEDNQSYFYNNNEQDSLHKLIKIFPIHKYESSSCQLMGITAFGDRLFFNISQSTNLLWNMELSFIRIRCPFLNYHQQHHQAHISYQPSIQMSSSPRNISPQACFHDYGRTFVNSFRNNNKSSDCLLLISRNNVETIKSKYYHRNQLIETIETSQSEENNNILSICCMSKEKYVSSSSFMLYSRKEIKKLNFGKPFIGLSQFAIQHLLPCPIYLCLRQKSIIFYKLLRYIDQFKLLLKAKNYQNILKFIEKIGLIECEVMCLLIMINYDKDSQDQSDDNEEKIIFNESYKLFMTPINNKIDILYQDIMQRLGCKSTKNLSIFLCLSRILRPIWSATICILSIENNNNVYCRYSVDELYRIINPLLKFKKILILFNNRPNNEIIEWISTCIQILNILIMLSRCHFSNIYDELSHQEQNLLQHICFEQLITKDCGYDLLKSIISLMILKLSDTDIKKLHSDCPTYFTSAQLITFLAKSQLNSSSELENSLAMFEQVCDDKSFDISDVCKLLINYKYYNGVIKLVFTLQNKLISKINYIAKQKLGVQQREENNTNVYQQREQIQNFENEMNNLNNRIIVAWNEIFECLRILYLQANNMCSGISISNSNLLSHSKERVLRLCLNETNRDFHYKFYDWFLCNKLINILFKYKPRYLENFLSETNNISDVDRNNRLIKLVYYYKENHDTNKMIKLLDALTKSNGFKLEERNNFLIEAKRATKQSLNNIKSSQYNPHNVINDKYNKFEEKSILCGIQLNIYHDIMEMEKKENGGCARGDYEIEKQDLYDLNYKLLNLERIYLISKKYELYSYALDCLSFTNDCSTIEHVNGCWLLYVANIIKKYGTEWTTHLLNNFHKIVNKYNLQQQPWMFDMCSILLYLNKTNYKTHKSPSNTIIIDAIYPKIKDIKYMQLIQNYKYLLNQIENEYKINIIESIYYLITKKIPTQPLNNNINQNNSYANPRLGMTVNSLVNTSSHSIISSTSNIQDLISNCMNYLERQNNHRNAPQIVQLTKQFHELAEQYSL